MNSGNTGRKKYRIGMALTSASAFQDLANNFIEPARIVEPEQAKQFAMNNLGHLIASATNMSLAIEIYLKAILSHLNIEPKNTHNLLKLFDSLPDKIGDELESKYNDLPKSHTGKVGCFHLLPKSDEDFSDKKFGIRAILESSKDAFVTWRYLYEHMEAKDRNDVIYEFHSLEKFASILKEHLLNQLKKTF